jgi:segregation and condensation protein A
MAFLVEQQSFKGPLELLLESIEKRKLFISEVSLAQVADDYITHVRSMGEYPIADNAQFILIASTLLLIKSKSLLPTLVLTNEEQGNIADLEQRLALYQKYKDLSLHIAMRFGRNIMREPIYRPQTIVFSPDTQTTTTGLVEAIRNLFKTFPKKDQLPKAVVQKVISLEEMITSLVERVTAGIKMSFKEFSKHGTGERVNIIVGFLAMLELVKQGSISVVQNEHFADISMETNSLNVPRYE